MSRRGEIFHAKSIITPNWALTYLRLLSEDHFNFPVSSPTQRLRASEQRLCTRHPSVHSQDGFLARISTAEEASVEELVNQVREFRLKGKFHREITFLYSATSCLQSHLTFSPRLKRSPPTTRPGFPVPAGYLIPLTSSQNAEESTFPRTEQQIR